ncbi:adenylate/guanylate cyclase domain-containing protein [Yeosuana sp. MJ-SS3]|uniref:Adenylate/guanylate cyclase domain-containing protein n=1 Tax=Gilvirhabdus luticola TaxID=3079858 RepID=A0ABU3UA65_9FLAO|nr:adenylate/guanylate cyclase domain-containing protein [Yeosuana sp. MJ-SS3]MDU8887219.1 adenylate/guanylate cyclase domain-containing protein [Yeosuana sp. MJ-SS3]
MSVHRHLSAIMFTDMQGYTSIMRYDEKKAIALRERHREIFQASTTKHNGKIIQYFGDGTLSIFKSTVEAVNCAIEMQLKFMQDPIIPVRIGIHVGDIVYSENEIIGDAVNVASRIEALGEAGSILISDKVHDQIRSRREIESKFLAVFDLKNVDEAVPVFAISNDGLVVPQIEDIKNKLKQSNNPKRARISSRKIALVSIILLILFLVAYKLDVFEVDETRYDKSIAVLPFDNLSVDDDSEIFSDGITEDILTNLAKIKDLHVISRTSIMQYKGTKKTIPEIAKELGVSYILEGSVQKYGDDIRVTAQLIDGKKDEHIWAENYDKTLTDIFEIQSEVSSEIVSALHLNLSFDEIQSLASIPTKNLEAYKLFLLGRREADKRNAESIAKSIELYEKAIELDPDYAEAYAEIANSIYLGTYYSGRNPKEAATLATEYLERAEAINNKISRIYTVKGLIYNIEKKYEEAEKAFETAIQLSPNDLTARHQYSTYFYYTNQPEKQLEQAKIAYKLDPLSFATANSYFTALIANYKYEEAERLMQQIERSSTENNKFVINRSYFRLYMDMKDYKKAIKPLKMLAKEQPVYNRFLGYCYGQLGDTLNAYKAIQTIRREGQKHEINYMTSVVFAGLKQKDSIIFYLDHSRNDQTRMLKRELDDFFAFLKDDPEFKNILKAHGLEDN